ncbi:MAG TPA: ammonium transporter [Croceibacterium sp.]
MIRKTALALAVLALPAAAHAQASATAGPDSGDTSWVLAASALVLLMTLPGLGLFYGGLVRAKNFLSVLIQVGAVAAVASLVWIVAGYTFAFGDVTNGLIGNGRAFMLTPGHLFDVRADTTLPESAFALFEMTFAAITPALMIGAWVDRARFSWVIVFAGLWSLIVYAPVAHWIWGGGWLAQMGVRDFAGGIVVHTTAGLSGLVVALLLGRRQGFPTSALLPHAPGLTMLGAMMLWVGWFGFNGGSALTASDNAASAIINTHAAAAAAALVWIGIERVTFGKPTTVGFATGAIAGLATVTPEAGYISPGGALLVGALAAAVCYYAIQLVKVKLRIDDSLDVFAVHGVGGMLGSILLALFMAAGFGGVGYDEGMTFASTVGVQALAVGAVALYSIVATALIALGVSLFLPMRVSEDVERQGLDVAEHGERAWEFD